MTQFGWAEARSRVAGPHQAKCLSAGCISPPRDAYEAILAPWPSVCRARSSPDARVSSASSTAAMTRAADGAPGVVLLGGEAGIGKSRLLSELATRAVDGGVRVLRGQCVSLEEAAIPLLPVADALRDLGEEGDSSARDLLDAVTSPLAGLDQRAAGRRADRSAPRARPRPARARGRREPGAARTRGPPVGRSLDPRPGGLPCAPPAPGAHPRRRDLPQRRGRLAATICSGFWPTSAAPRSSSGSS